MLRRQKEEEIKTSEEINDGMGYLAPHLSSMTQFRFYLPSPYVLGGLLFKLIY